MELDSFVSTMVPYKLANNATENSNSNSKRAEREIEEMEKDGKKKYNFVCGRLKTDIKTWLSTTFKDKSS